VKPRLLIVLVDALGWQLAGRDASFLPQLPHRKSVETILGFSSGALPTVFSGRLPKDHGRWLMYRRASGPGVFAGFERLRWLPRRVRESWRLGRWLTREVHRRGVRGYFNLYEVPRDELAHFDLPERDDIFAPGGLPVDTLWDALERRHVRWRGWNWRTPEPAAFDALEARLALPDDDVLFLYTADLDALLHHEGSAGPRVRERLATYGERLRRAFAAAERGGRPLWAYVCSDHGMVDVTSTVDARRVVDALPFRRGRDYVAFYDSTMARFWWLRAGVRDVVRAALSAEPRGHWLDAGALEAAGAGFADHRYGDDIWLLEPGALLVPSFMGSRPLAAMHGYDASHPDMAAMLASNRPLPVHVRALADLRAFFESEVDAMLAGAA
jgi:hypothetical protein